MRERRRHRNRGEAPRMWANWLASLMPPEQRDAAAGDAEEAFRGRAERGGEAAARRWRRRQVLRSVPAAIGRKAVDPSEISGKERVRSRMDAWIGEFRTVSRVLRGWWGYSAPVMIALVLREGITPLLFGIYRSLSLGPIPSHDPDGLIVILSY